MSDFLDKALANAPLGHVLLERINRHLAAGEQAEKAVARVRAALAEFDGRGVLGDPRCWPLPTVGDVLAAVSSALDEPDESADA